MPVTKLPEDLTRLSEDKLLSLWDSVSEEALERKEAARQLAHEVDRRNTETATREKFARMTSLEREALLQMIQTEGIETLEQVGPQSDSARENEEAAGTATDVVVDEELDTARDTGDEE